MVQPFENLTRDEVLSRSLEHIFSMGMNDSAGALCKANMKYGLAKIHYLQNSLGLDPDATFIGAPDATVTRNTHRWSYGFGYGGKISWGDGREKLVVLDSMPNACGMLVGSLDKKPATDMLIERVSGIQTSDDSIEGIQIQWDFAVGNHFVDLYRYKSVLPDEESPSQYAFIIHGSVPELKGDNDSKFGFGLYPHKSETLREMAEIIDTPFGDIRILTGDDADRYLELHSFAVELSRKKREKAAGILFEGYTEICSPVHQGLLNLNEAILGCHCMNDEKSDALFPLALRADIPAYLMRGVPSLKEEAIEHLGFARRAQKHGVMNRLLDANILPHGGGYSFPTILGVNKVIETADNIRYFVVDVETGHETEEIFSNPRELEFSYRGKQVVNRSVELELCEIVAQLVPRVVLKV